MEMKIRLFVSVLIAITLFLLVGCATTRDLRSVQGQLQGQIQELQQKVDSLKGKVSSEMQQSGVNFETSLEQLRQENKILKTNIDEDRELLNKIANDVETLKREYEAMGSTVTKEKKEDTVASPAPQAAPLTTKAEEEEPKEDIEGTYQKAYGTFKEGDYPNAVKQFEAFLDTYPQSKYADNAQYWIGECYYKKADYERAIVEYEKVIKKYPRGDKLPSAILKEGFAFLELGDRANAKLLFNKVLKQYPHSPQAEIAAKKLKVLD
jgi:tol-pal system protein YbgF